jgi:hypothetical protein
VILFVEQHLSPEGSGGGGRYRDVAVVSVTLVVLTSMMAFVPLLGFIFEHGTGPVTRFFSHLKHLVGCSAPPTPPPDHLEDTAPQPSPRAALANLLEEPNPPADLQARSPVQLLQPGRDRPKPPEVAP